MLPLSAYYKPVARPVLCAGVLVGWRLYQRGGMFGALCFLGYKWGHK